MENRLNQLCSVHSREYFAAIKKNWVVSWQHGSEDSCFHCQGLGSALTGKLKSYKPCTTTSLKKQKNWTDVYLLVWNDL